MRMLLQYLYLCSDLGDCPTSSAEFIHSPSVRREKDSYFSLGKAAPQGIQSTSKSQAVAPKSERWIWLATLLGQETGAF